MSDSVSVGETTVTLPCPIPERAIVIRGDCPAVIDLGDGRQVDLRQGEEATFVARFVSPDPEGLDDPYIWRWERE